MISTSGGVDYQPPVATKANLAKTLARSGYPQTVIDELLALLHEPIDARQAGSVFGHYGITPEVLMGRLGASP